MQRKPITIKPQETLRTAWQLLRQHRIRHLPVVEKGRLVGIVTDRDIRRALQLDATSLEFHELLDLLDRVKVRDIMSTKIITVTPETPVEEAARIMVEMKIGCLPVLEGERPVGIITENDLLKALVDLLKVWTTPARLGAA
jgi:CBS domain-containing protein